MSEKTAAERITNKLGIPSQVLPGVVKLTVTGDSRAVVENHTGIAQLTDELVEIDGGRRVIKLRGEGLEMLSMDKEEIVVEGKIFSVDFE